MPRLLLLQPPIEDFYDTDIRLQPIGLCLLKAAVERYLPHWQVEVRDFHQNHGRKTIAVPRELAYLKKYYTHRDQSPFSTFHQYFRFGADADTIGREVAAARPDLVGVSSLFTPYYREVLECAAAIKKKLNVPIIVGGSHVSSAPESVLSDPSVDFIIRGEGERPLVEFLHVFSMAGDLRQVPNLGFKEQGRMIFNPVAANYPLAEIPDPDFSDLPVGRYLYQGRPICFLLTSRGCPHRCGFCSVHRTFGTRYRRRQPGDVVREMKALYEKGYRVFDFEDDNLTFDLKSFKKLCLLIIDQFAGCGIQLLAMNGISYASLDLESLRLMRTAGFTHLNLALVSTDEKVLAAQKRPHRVGDFSVVAGMAHGLGFQVVAHQILGLPGETLDAMIETLAFLARHPLLIGVSIFYLTPGAPVAQGFPEMSPADFFRSRSTAMAIESPGCTRDDLFTLFISARIFNFVKGISSGGRELTLTDFFARSGGVEPRIRRGFSLLEELLLNHRLHASCNGVFHEVARFNASLFFRVWNRVGRLSTQDGGAVILSFIDHPCA